MATRSRPRKTKRSSTRKARPGVGGAIEYADFVIRARRKNARNIEITVDTSPAGQLSRPVTIEFPASEADGIRSSFRTDLRGSSGRGLITQAEATELGKRLADVLLPPPVFNLLAESLADCVRRRNRGLRIRLAFDKTLIDLPWEYVYRPDRIESDALSGFLLLEPTISMVRMPAQPMTSLAPVTGKQTLDFIGAFWQGSLDGWEVWKEYDLLRTALKPVAKYLSMRFTIAADAFGEDWSTSSAIFHYAGHCDFGSDGRTYLIQEMPTESAPSTAPRYYMEDLANAMRAANTRLVVLSACNSGHWPVVEPLLQAGVAALIGVNGAVLSNSTIEFCERLYESLAVGLSLDEAVGRARVHAMERGKEQDLFDWGLYMVYMPSAQAVLFPRASSAAVAKHQKAARKDHEVSVRNTVQRARELDGLNFGEIMSELTRRRVLILGRFIGRRLKILEAIQEHLARHPNRYIAELFTYRRPESRDLVESVVGFAALSRFIIADLSEPRSIQSELEAIVPRFLSVPVVPVINRTGKEWATFSSLQREQNVIKPTLRYRDLDDLLSKLVDEIVPMAEAKRLEVMPPA